MAHEEEARLETERWEIFEYRLQGPQTGNPYTDIQFKARFAYGHRTVEAEGFYDGDGDYVIRFMPDTPGTWTFETVSNAAELSGRRGTLQCVESSPGNRGPVRVDKTFHFAYADGTPFYPVGTTCYVWNHQGRELEERTLDSLSRAPFNKLRMCVFPKHYDYNDNEPELYPFEGTPGAWDFSRFNPLYWRHLERRIRNLQQLGIEADLILFHPYDRWGFARMSLETDHRYLRYALARLSSFRNIWWSLANEYDLMHDKSMRDWDDFFRLIQEYDPYQHLRSIHNWHNPEIHYRSSGHWYDHGKPWVTHASIQHHDLYLVPEWREQYGKPVIVDECRYEGNLNHGWGNITAERMAECFWEGMCRGGYVTHGETYMHPEQIIWWSHGGELHGQSPDRIRFLRDIMEAGPQLGTPFLPIKWDAAAGGTDRNIASSILARAVPPSAICSFRKESASP
ncbi:Putative endoglucanase [Paenibacillus konkukensis]|uniref:Endoglucanase n=1 Tax=Paenibacillus konkukensis TaxID=2020716 RepID=A0ABY4RUH5_9BACL|nr:Putative endoglucanase [Paenibacillus konkukensis]